MLILIITATVALAWTPPTAASYARYHHRHHTRHHAHSRHVVRGPLYHAELLEDADTGRVLYAQNATLEWPPASMTKLMLMLVVEDEIKAGHVHPEDPVRISWLAAHTGGSHLGLREGQVFPLSELMKAALIRSANDAAVAVAQGVCGSVEVCVQKMNLRARSLGMTETHYGTVEGLPPTPGHDVDYTSAFDMATLARAIIHHTDLLQWTGMEQMPFDGGLYILHNTNHLIGHFEGCDGLKTGFTLNAGFNLTATAIRGNMRLISVVLGAPSNPERFALSAKLLEWGFDNFEKIDVLKRGQPLPVHVQVESGPLIQPVAKRDVAVLVPKNDMSALKVEYQVPAMINGPVTSGQSLGQVVLMVGDEVMTSADAVCPRVIDDPAATGNTAVSNSRDSGEGVSVGRTAPVSLGEHAVVVGATNQATQENK